MTEPFAVTDATGALEVTAAAADLRAGPRAIRLHASVAIASATFGAADLVMGAAGWVAIQTDAWATSVAVAIGASCAATLGLVTAAGTTEATAADGIEPATALPIAFQ